MNPNSNVLVCRIVRRDCSLTKGSSPSATEKGSVTLLGAILIGIGLLLSLVVLEVGGLVAQRAHVSAAADAAALAAAQELALGSWVGCCDRRSTTVGECERG